MTVYKFESVKLSANKSGKCVCGKRVTRSVTLEQTINPFNKNAKGEVKSYSEIWKELKTDAAEWKDKAAYHSRAYPRDWHALSEKGVVVLSCGEQISKESYN